MNFGLKDTTVAAILEVLKQYDSIEQVLLYGSRAKGNFRAGSDIDLTIRGAGLSLRELSQLENQLDDLFLPYKIDLSLYHHIDNPELLDHIHRVGKVIYSRQHN